MQRPVLQSKEVLNGYVYFASDGGGVLAGVRLDTDVLTGEKTITFICKPTDGKWMDVSLPVGVDPGPWDGNNRVVANHNGVFHDGERFVAALLYATPQSYDAYDLHIWTSESGSYWVEQERPVMPSNLHGKVIALYGLSNGVILCVVREMTDEEYPQETGRSLLLESADGGVSFAHTGISMPDAYLDNLLVSRGNGVTVVQLPLNVQCQNGSRGFALRVSRRRYLLVKKSTGTWIKHVVNADAPDFPDWLFGEATQADTKMLDKPLPHDWAMSPYYTVEPDENDPFGPGHIVAKDWRSSVVHDSEGFDPPIPIITEPLTGTGWRAKRAFDILHDVWFSRQRNRFVCGNKSSTDALTWVEDAPLNDDVYLTMPIAQAARAGGHDTDRWHLSIRYPYADVGPFVPLEHYSPEWLGARYAGDRVFIEPMTGSPGLAMVYGIRFASKDPQLPQWARPIMKSADGSSALTYIEQERLTNYIDSYGPHSTYYTEFGGSLGASIPGRQNILVAGEQAWLVTRYSFWSDQEANFVTHTEVFQFRLPPPDQFWEKKVFAYE